eukprot:scaffold26514_cov53-Phaeocystis_antarctica.AAC.3
MRSLLALDKEFVFCRVARRAYDAGRAASQEAGGPRALEAQAACRGGLDCRFGAGQGAERTANMPYMVVTLEVLKLSGWLNADALCRESKQGHMMPGVVQTGRPEVAGDRGARMQRAGEGSTADWEEQGTGRSARRT